MLYSPNSSFTDDLQFAWDSTSLKLAEECPRKYQYTMLEQWTSVGRGVHIRFGGHYATALEHFHKHLALGMPREEAIEAVVLEALIETWEYDWIERTPEEVKQGSAEKRAILGPDAAPLPVRSSIPGTGHPWRSDHNAKTRENLIRTIVWYLDEFENDPATVITLANGKPAVEYSFSFVVDNNIVFCGHLDKLVEFSTDPYVMDQKTSGSTVTQHYFAQYNPDIQMSMYSFAGKVILGAPVRGVIIDAAQIAVGFSRFERGFTFRTEAQLDEWYDHMMALIERIHAYSRAGFFPMNTSACGNFGGCAFRGVCSRDAAVRQRFLEADFVRRAEPWDPLRRR